MRALLILICLIFVLPYHGKSQDKLDKSEEKVSLDLGNDAVIGAKYKRADYENNPELPMIVILDGKTYYVSRRKILEYSKNKSGKTKEDLSRFLEENNIERGEKK